MAAWKQLLFALVILAAAAAAWVQFAPGSHDVLARWGIDWAQAAAPATAGGATAGGNRQGGGRGPQTAVITAAVSTATINDRLQAIGSGRANASVAITPYTSGRITSFEVTPGSKVSQGQVIARLDSDLEEIAVARAKIAEQDAISKLDRVKSLRTSNAATPVQVADAQLVLENARLAVRDAELTLERRNVVSPMEGIVGILPIEAGNYVTSSTVVATIDDRSSIKVDFYVPERFAANMVVGGPLTAAPIARPDQVVQGTVSAVDNRVDEKSRTLLVQATIPNAGDTLRAGMSFKVDVRFPGDSYPAVSPLAIQWGTDGSFIWIVRDGKAQRVPVSIVQRNTESVLIAAQGISPGDSVVIEGVHTVREGADVMVARGETPTPIAAGSGS
jgi:RND family efflux transporter MFP subunit